MIVKKLRNKHHWSQEQLAEMCNLSVRTIQRVENGQNASLETLKSLSSVFEVNIETLTKEITVIDKQSEAWQKLPLIYRVNMWGIGSRKSLLRGEFFLIVSGILILLLKYEEFSNPQLLSAPVMFLCAYLFGWFVRYGDKKDVW